MPGQIMKFLKTKLAEIDLEIEQTTKNLDDLRSKKRGIELLIAGEQKSPVSHISSESDLVIPKTNVTDSILASLNGVLKSKGQIKTDLIAKGFTADSNLGRAIHTGLFQLKTKGLVEQRGDLWQKVNH